MPNTDLIDNLPQGCCVEVPCLVDGNGIQPTKVGSLPAQLAALNRTNINVQELIVEASLHGGTEAVYHAVMLDPLTAAVCTLAPDPKHGGRNARSTAAMAPAVLRLRGPPH